MKLKHKFIFLLRKRDTKEKKEELEREKETDTGGRREEREKRGKEKRQDQENKEKASFLDQRKMQQVMESFFLWCFPAWTANFWKVAIDLGSWIPVSDFPSYAISLLLVYKPQYRLHE